MLELELGLLSGGAANTPPLQTISLLNQTVKLSPTSFAVKLTPSNTTVKLTTTGVPGPKGDDGDIGPAGPAGPTSPQPTSIDGGHF